MIIIVDGFPKSGKTTLAKKLCDEIGGVYEIEPIPYKRPDSFFELLSDLEFMSNHNANVVMDGSVFSDTSFEMSTDEIGVLGTFCNNHDIFFYFCHSKNYEKMKEVSEMTDDLFGDYGRKLYDKYTALHMFCPIITHDIYKTTDEKGGN